MTFVLTWSISVAMTSVEDGGVVFTATAGATNNDFTSEGDLHWNPDVSVVAGEIKGLMDQSLPIAIQKAKTDLMNALANQLAHVPQTQTLVKASPILNLSSEDRHVFS